MRAKVRGEAIAAFVPLARSTVMLGSRGGGPLLSRFAGLILVHECGVD
jgi:hypothetical protein